MSTLSLLLNTQNHWLVDGSQTIWPISFSGGYIDPTHVKAYVVDALEVRTNLTINPEDFVGPYQLQITPAVALGSTLVIFRDTPKDLPLVDFLDGGRLTEVSLDTVAKQAVFVSAESADFLGVTTAADIIDLSIEVAASVGTAAASAASASASAATSTADKIAAAASAASAAASAASAGGAVASAVAAYAAALAASGGSALIGHIRASTGAVARTVQDILRDRVSVRDFGADPTGVVDASTAFANAHAALPSTGGEIYIPAGAYLLNSPWVITKPVQVTGCGGTAVVNGGGSATKLIKPATATGAAIQITGGGTGSKLQAFLIQGIAGNTGDGISIETGRVSLEDINVFAMGQDGVRIGTDAGVNANLWFIKNLRSKNNGRYGLHVSDKVSPTLADANGGCLIHADLQSNTNHGCHIGNAQLNSFHHVVCQSNGARGLSLSPGADYNIFIGGDYESNGADEINIEAGATGNTFIGGTVTGSLTDSGTGSYIVNVIGTNWAGGVQFGNVGSTNTKSLDWYEEGSWTPVLTFVTPGNLAVTYSAQVGRYTRIGNLVTVECSIITSAFTHTTASGAMQVSGLPFTSQVLTNYFSVGALQYSGITAATTPSIVARVDQSKTVVGFFGSGSGVANVTITPTQAPTGASIILLFTLTYQAN